MRSTVVLCLLLAISCSKADDSASPVSEPVPFVIDEVPLTQFVDPLVGTSGLGNTIPGALVPHGVMRASPDTVDSPSQIGAYHYEATALHGFTHTHLEGPGGSGNGYSQLLLLPTSGPLDLDKETRVSAFSHDTETARPGYYGVTLDDYGIDVALTATGHAAIHRYSFPAGEAHVVLDLGHSQGVSVMADVQISGKQLSGRAVYNIHPIASLMTNNDGTTAHSTLYYTIELSEMPASVGTFSQAQSLISRPGDTEISLADSGAWVDFDFAGPTVVELRVGLSHISVDQARLNLDREVGERSFEEIETQAEQAWNSALNRVQVEADNDRKSIFYTALYRSFFQPADYTEANGDFAVGTSGEMVTVTTAQHRFYTDDWCMWDTFRTSHPWRTLVEPETVGDITSSMLLQYRQGGWLPKCTWNATGYSRVMTGNPAVPIIADAVVKGLDDFDTDLAWEAVDHAGTADIDELPDLICGYINLGTPSDYVDLGYVPTECDPDQSVSMTLEYAQADFATARMAETLGRTADAARYDARANNWKNHWNPQYGFMQARNRAGDWVEPFDPNDEAVGNDFVEGDSQIYSFFVPHDVPGLIAEMGGDQVMVDRLDAFFDEGHFDVTNQPSYHIPWLYASAGRADLTQSRVRAEIVDAFATGPDGLPGNDDAGSTSVWGLLGMLGLYPLSPGDPTWTLSTPQFTRAKIHLHPGYYDGGVFEIVTVGDPESQPFIASVTLDGEPWTESNIAHSRIVAGGLLEVTLSATATDWGR